MDMFKHGIRGFVDHGRRMTVDLMSGGGIEKDSPHSPAVPFDLRAWLPDILDRFPIVFPWEKPKPIDPALHSVWILDNTAFRTPAPGDRDAELAELQDPNYTKPTTTTGAPFEGPNGWEAEFVACYFIKNSGKDLSHLVSYIVKQLNIDDNDIACKKRIAERLQPFIDTILPKRTVRVTVSNPTNPKQPEEQTLGPSSYSGISAGLHSLHLPIYPETQTLTTIPTSLPPPFSLPSTTYLASPTGWGLISDIDDTIKLTLSPSPLGILANTFTTPEFEPIPSMPPLYAHLNTLLSNPIKFYLSASPYNLYPFLHRFIKAHYPPGQLILRDASWQNLGGLIASLQNGTQEYKVDRMRKIHAWLPRRRFICIGDSTQTDPEAYGEVARAFPGWVRGVFIRKVTGVSGMDEESKNKAERFEKAFQGVDCMWRVFERPEEVESYVRELVGRVKA